MLGEIKTNPWEHSQEPFTSYPMRDDLRGRDLEIIYMIGAFFNWGKQKVSICMPGPATPRWMPVYKDKCYSSGLWECLDATRRVGPRDNEGAPPFVPQLQDATFQAERQLLLPWWYPGSNQIHWALHGLRAQYTIPQRNRGRQHP